MNQPRTTLQQARQQKGWTQVHVAKLLGVTSRSYQRYEAGERTPSLKLAMQMEQIFGVKLQKLLVQDSTAESKVQ